ncbi:DUF4097 family beta strand repeat-containing protein [Actinomadura parmotrematis]|uniref:DUF4097 domain-containing protein n=1 Tax=Actinomadura parmotrematis TaxID=2864039 RepID=A0ABS7G0I7_9ACTN|nr:DUF4097 family beta strand repeat-containing protein [Actinomadura parmotrematis]MBW8486229.1 DUF4097 domain-containing protein [Actinomadura parmotrematis]
MARWTIDEPATLDFDGAVALRATLVAGSVSVLATDERPSLTVAEVRGQPLTVTHEAGMLTIGHERLLEGVLGWFGASRVRADITVTVPRECPVTLNLVSADAVVSGLAARTSIKSASGLVTLDGVTGAVDANTVSGAVEAQGLDGSVAFTSLSGDLSLAGGTLARLAARSVSGRIAADVALGAAGRIEVNTVTGEVTLRVPDSTGARVSLNSAAGEINSTFAGLDRDARPAARHLSGRLGDGSGRLAVQTVSGGVTLLHRPGGAREDGGAGGTTTPRTEK